MLFGFIPETDLQQFLDKAALFLQCGKTADECGANKKDMDFWHDRAYINASFMSDYKLDLSTAKLHWWQFCELIQGLTENCVLSRVREIRNYDLNEIKDSKSKAKMAKAKEAVALPVKHTREELEAIDAFERLFEGG